MNDNCLQIKILHLVLYSESEYYTEMLNITSKYYKILHNVDTIYYRFSNDIDNEYELLKYDNYSILLIKGIETYSPGITVKTIKAFKYFENVINNYDYVVRTNISTIVNFNMLRSALYTNPIDYGGGNVINRTYCYIQGTCIILSKSLTNNIIQSIDKMDINIIDDITISMFIYEINPNIPVIKYCLNIIHLTNNLILFVKYLKNVLKSLIALKNKLSCSIILCQ